MTNPSKYMQDYLRHATVYLRAQFEAAYGRQCNCCGSTFNLEVDHVANNAGKDGLARGGANLLRQLKKLGWPRGYQALCSSCNQSKRKTGVCLHESFRILYGGVG